MKKNKGIYHQLQTTQGVDTGKYYKLTYEKLRELVEDTFKDFDLKNISKSRLKKEWEIEQFISENLLTEEEVEAKYGKIDDKLRKGFMYYISDSLWTGCGGARDIVKAMREKGWTEYQIGFMIEISQDGGKTFHCLHQITFPEDEEIQS